MKGGEKEGGCEGEYPSAEFTTRGSRKDHLLTPLEDSARFLVVHNALFSSSSLCAVTHHPLPPASGRPRILASARAPFENIVQPVIGEPAEFKQLVAEAAEVGVGAL